MLLENQVKAEKNARRMVPRKILPNGKEMVNIHELRDRYRAPGLRLEERVERKLKINKQTVKQFSNVPSVNTTKELLLLGSWEIHFIV